MIIFSNIIGFDGLIFILAAINIFVFLAAKKSSDDLYRNMHRSIYAPSLVNDNRSMMGSVSDLTDQKVSELRENAVSKYTMFTTIIAIFPLMGILGTVISLLGMVGDAADMQDQFLGALTSTFWGLVFAIIFKGIDGALISSKLEDGEHAADLFMQRKIDNSGDYSDGYMPSADHYNTDRYRNNRNYKGGRKNNAGSSRSYTNAGNERQNNGNASKNTAYAASDQATDTDQAMIPANDGRVSDRAVIPAAGDISVQNSGMPYRTGTPEASGSYSDNAPEQKKKFEDIPSFDELYSKKKKH